MKHQHGRSLLRAHQRRNPRQRMYLRELIERRIRNEGRRFGVYSSPEIVRYRIALYGMAETWPRCILHGRTSEMFDAWTVRSGRTFMTKQKRI